MLRKRTAKVLALVFGSILLAILLLVLICHWNDYFFRAVPEDNVAAVNLTVKNFLNHDMEVYLDDSEMIHQVIVIEDITRKNDGTNSFLKCQPWTIEMEYIMKDGTTEKRTYKGQTEPEELQEEFLKIPQIKKIVKPQE